MSGATLVVKRAGLFCVVCTGWEHVTPGEGTSLPSYMDRLKDAARKHHNCAEAAEATARREARRKR